VPGGPKGFVMTAARDRHTSSMTSDDEATPGVTASQLTFRGGKDQGSSVMRRRAAKPSRSLFASSGYAAGGTISGVRARVERHSVPTVQVVVKARR
jgi:hypothetical protein